MLWTEKKLTAEIWWRLHVGQHVSGSNRRWNPIGNAVVGQQYDKTRADKWSTSCCVAAKKEGRVTSHVCVRFLSALLWLLRQRRSFFFFSPGRGADVSTAPGDRIGPFFSDPQLLGLNRSSRASWWGQSRLACGNLTKPAGVRPFHSARAPQGAAALRRPRNRSTTEGCLWPLLRGCALLLKSPVNFS